MKNFIKGAKKSKEKKLIKKTEQRTLLEAAAAKWKMVKSVSFPVTVEMSVLNTENKWFIYVT